jgi:hypothetical protein
MTAHEPLKAVATFCGKCSCGCPQLWVDPDAAPEKRIVLTDDFGQRIQMSADQWESLVTQARSVELVLSGDAPAR